MQRIKSKIINHLKNFNGKDIDIDRLALNESLTHFVPENSHTKSVDVTFVKIENPNNQYSTFITEAPTLDFETDKYDYYTVYEKAGLKSFRDNAKWNLRIPKEVE